MPKSESAERPNAWAVLVEYTKTLVTLASALLALTVTFASQIVPKGVQDVERWALIAAWGFLIFTIICAIWSAAFVVNVLFHDRKKRGAVFLANCAFFGLVLATAAFLVVGIMKTG